MISWWEVFCHTRSMEIKAIPKRTRFYHAKIDSANLASCEDYSCLRNVVVIFITIYDPFGLDRMVYIVKNRCVEEPDMPYEDVPEHCICIPVAQKKVIQKNLKACFVIWKSLQRRMLHQIH